MENPGIFTLAALQIDTAKDVILTPTISLEGMTAVSLEAVFNYGSGGTTCSAIVLTSFDSGLTWRQIARFDFTTAKATKVANLSGLLSKAVSVYADLVSEGVNDGLLGDQLAARIISTGTYAGSTTLSVRASVR
jgi:hypothetical protein